MDAVEAAFKTIGAVPPERARVVHIKSTLEMGEMDVSEALLDEMNGRADLTILRKLGPLSFDKEGNIERVSF